LESNGPSASRDISRASSNAIESIAQPIADAVAHSGEHAQAVSKNVGEAITEQAARVNRGARNAYRSIKKSRENCKKPLKIPYDTRRLRQFWSRQALG
jgi:hypothetical protein